MRNRKGFFGVVLGLLFALMFMYCQGPEGPAGPKGEKGDAGDQGDPGDAGVSIVWKGEFDAAPARPELYWAYFNTDSGNAYIYTGKKWELLSRSGADGEDGADGANGIDGVDGSDGSDGVDGVSISWRGTLSAHPGSPKLNWAYYNSADKVSYIYDGSKWQELAKDGEIGPQGLTGGKGDTGPKGNDGDPNGSQGPKGDDGANVYLVVFNSMGGEPLIDAVGVNHGGTVAPLTFEKSGYVVSGWYTDKNLTAAYNFNTTVTGNLTLYAKWTVGVTYTITYSANGGSGTAPAAQSVNQGSSVTLANVGGLTRSGYTFGGWNSNSSGTGTNYGAGASYTPTGNVTLYAKWTDNSGGSGTESNPIALTADVTANGSMSSGVSAVWYSMAVTSGTRYTISWGDTDNGGGTMDVKVSAYYGNGSQIFDNDTPNSYSFTASSSGTVKIKIYPYNSSVSGTFTIGYSVVIVVQPSIVYGPNVSHGSETYQTVIIGTQTWFARNLNYDVPNNTSDVCYGDDPDNCAKYGRLYDWATAKTACPSGWHLPSDAEWTTLENAVGGSSTAGTALKSTTGWYTNYGTDDYGFAALPGGNGFSGGNFYYAGSYGYWWCATENDAYDAWNRVMYYDSEIVLRNYYGMSSLFSVRCVED